MGLLFFEINANLGKETVDMLMAKSFINIELKKDMQGKDRMIRCIKAQPV
jgi:release factor glutamine methyltransferase